MEIKKCRYCGNELKAESLFCNKCGKAVVEKRTQENNDRDDKHNRNEDNIGNISVNINLNGMSLSKIIKNVCKLAIGIGCCILIGKLVITHFDRPDIEEIKNYIINDIDPNSYVTWANDYDYEGNYLEGEEFFYDLVDVTEREKQKNGDYLVSYNAEITNTTHKLFLSEEIEYMKIDGEWVPGEVRQQELPIFGPADDKVCERKITELLHDKDFDSIRRAKLNEETNYSYTILSIEEAEKILPNKYVRGYKKGKILENIGAKIPFEEDIQSQIIKIECDCNRTTDYVVQKGEIIIYAVWCVYYTDLNDGGWDATITDELAEEQPENIISADYSVEWSIDGKYSLEIYGEKYTVEIEKTGDESYLVKFIDDAGNIDEITGKCEWDNALKQSGSIWLDESVELFLSMDGLEIYAWDEENYGPYALARVLD